MEKQPTFSLDESQIQFIDGYQNYGFKDSSELVRTALQRFQLELETEMRESAELYAEIYAEEQDLQELTESALQEWPEAIKSCTPKLDFDVQLKALLKALSLELNS